MEDYLFKWHIVDGYSFRNMLNIIKYEINQATMILSTNLIEISFMNNTKCAVHKIFMNPRESPEWIYNCKDDENHLMEEYPIGFDTEGAFNTVKNIGKNDGIRLFMLPGDNTVMVQPLKAAAKDPGQIKILRFSVLQTEYSRYSVPKYSDEPNIKIFSKSFTDMCSEAVNEKCEVIEIEGKGGLMTFRGYNGNKKEMYTNRFGEPYASNNNHTTLASNMSEVDNLIAKLNLGENSNTNSSSANLKLKVVDNNAMNIKIPIVTIKSLTRIDNISPKGSLLKFYFETNQPIKMETAISTYGTYEIYLR